MSTRLLGWLAFLGWTAPFLFAIAVGLADLFLDRLEKDLAGAEPYLFDAAFLLSAGLFLTALAGVARRLRSSRGGWGTWTAGVASSMGILSLSVIERAAPPKEAD